MRGDIRGLALLNASGDNLDIGPLNALAVLLDEDELAVGLARKDRDHAVVADDLADGAASVWELDVQLVDLQDLAGKDVPARQGLLVKWRVGAEVGLGSVIGLHKSSESGTTKVPVV